MRCGLFEALKGAGEWSCIQADAPVVARAKNESRSGDVGVCMVSLIVEFGLMLGCASLSRALIRLFKTSDWGEWRT